MKMTKDQSGKYSHHETLEDVGLLSLKMTDTIVFKYIKNKHKRKESEVLQGRQRKWGWYIINTFVHVKHRPLWKYKQQ